MKEIEDILPSQFFLRVQKSFIVHLGQIESFNTKEITLLKGAVVQVGRQYYNSFLSKLNTITESWVNKKAGKKPASLALPNNQPN